MTANENTEDTDEVLSVRELMARWKCGHQTVYDAIRSGRLRAFKIGDRPRSDWRIHRDEVLRFERENVAKTDAEKVA